MEDAGQTVRAVNHLTITRPAIPAPGLFVVLADAARLGHGLAQALPQPADCLAASLDTHTTGMEDGTDPLAAVLDAADLLTTAAGHATAVGDACARARAQTVIVRQHATPHEAPDTDSDRRGPRW